MRIGVTYKNGQIFQYLGHAEQFKLYNMQEGKVINTQVIDTNGNGHGALSSAIRLCGGVAGNADGAVAVLLAGKFAYDPDVRCGHHEHNHGEGHACAEHD